MKFLAWRTLGSRMQRKRAGWWPGCSVARLKTERTQGMSRYQWLSDSRVAQIARSWAPFGDAPASSLISPARPAAVRLTRKAEKPAPRTRRAR
jgi:hypothetical protein